jgi:hypothetical protein
MALKIWEMAGLAPSTIWSAGVRCHWNSITNNSLISLPLCSMCYPPPGTRLPHESRDGHSHSKCHICRSYQPEVERAFVLIFQASIWGLVTRLTWISDSGLEDGWEYVHWLSVCGSHANSWSIVYTSFSRTTWDPMWFLGKENMHMYTIYTCILFVWYIRTYLCIVQFPLWCQVKSSNGLWKCWN